MKNSDILGLIFVLIETKSCYMKTFTKTFIKRMNCNALACVLQMLKHSDKQLYLERTCIFWGKIVPIKTIQLALIKCFHAFLHPVSLVYTITFVTENVRSQITYNCNWKKNQVKVCKRAHSVHLGTAAPDFTKSLFSLATLLSIRPQVASSDALGSRLSGVKA